MGRKLVVGARRSRAGMGAAGLLLGLVVGCGTPAFDVPVSSETTIKGAGLVGQLVDAFGPFAGFTAMDLTDTREFKNQGIDRNQVESVRLKSLRLSATEPSGADFDFLSSLAFHVEADGLPKRRVASLSPIPRDAGVLELALDDVELAPYVAAPSMSLTTEASGNPPARDTKVKAEAVFRVVPKIF